MSDGNETVESAAATVNRRSFLGIGAGALAVAALTGVNAEGQSRETMQKGQQDHSASNPGPVNKSVADRNSSSEMPPPTDRGDVNPFWFSFDLSHRRVQEGGWTRQVTQRDLPDSKDLAGVNMRLTAGSYRELHWHTANEWAYMIYGKARITVLNPDGTIFIDDVEKGDLWFFPAGFPHSIQGLGPDGCEFLLVFDEGLFSEYQTFLISDWVAHTPPSVLAKNFKLPESQLSALPDDELYIFPSEVPGSLEQDREAVGGKRVASAVSYTFKMLSMPPTKETEGGSARVVDSRNFPASKTVAAALVIVKPGALRELHWHPNSSEWQYYLAGSGRMTMFASSGKARTMNFYANDVGFVPKVAGHYIENTGDTDLMFLEVFKASRFEDFSLNNWIRRVPPEMAKAHLNLNDQQLKAIPAEKQEIIAG